MLFLLISYLSLKDLIIESESSFENSIDALGIDGQSGPVKSLRNISLSLFCKFFISLNEYQDHLNSKCEFSTDNPNNQRNIQLSIINIYTNDVAYIFVFFSSNIWNGDLGEMLVFEILNE